MRIHRLILIAALTRSVPALAQGATVSGVVYDSIARAPLAGAMVQLVAPAAPALTATADSAGRYRIAGVPDGRYTIGFFHPMLDSLVVEPVLREVTVERGQSVRADLAIPGPARLRSAICGNQADSGAVLTGTIRNARDGSTVAGAEAVATWLEITLTPRGYVPGRPRRTVKANDTGWFALCNVPAGGVMTLSAGHGSDSSDVIDLEVPRAGYLRRDLYVGSSRTIVIGDTTRVDTAALAPRRVHLGDVRLTGTVMTAEGARPVAGAQVGIVNGPQARANERGEWTIVDAPAGTRVLEVRAVSYYPVRQAIDVMPGIAPVGVKVHTLKAMLDTVKVTASRLRGRDITGFLERSRAGPGRYITEERIARRAPREISEMFHMVPGMKLEGHVIKSLTVRGAFGRCRPTFFIDGSQFDLVTVDDIDDWIRPSDVAGIEIYTEHAPPQFQNAMSGCGSVVIWTK